MSRRPDLRLPRLFAGSADEPRSRRATDLLWVVASVLALGFLGAIAAPPAGIERRLLRFLLAVPRSFQALWHVFSGALSIAVILLLVAIVFARRWAVLRDVVIAGALAVAIALVVSRLATGAWPSAPNPLYASPDAYTFPPFALAAATAMVSTGSPHLTRPARRAGRWLIGLAVFGSVLGLGATPTSALGALFVATASAAAVHLVFGSCEGRPSLRAHRRCHRSAADRREGTRRRGAPAHRVVRGDGGRRPAPTARHQGLRPRRARHATAADLVAHGLVPPQRTGADPGSSPAGRARGVRNPARAALGHRHPGRRGRGRDADQRRAARAAGSRAADRGLGPDGGAAGMAGRTADAPDQDRARLPGRSACAADRR